MLHAHYADAIPLDVLRREQERITRGLAGISSDLERLSQEASISKAHLRAALDLLEDCAATYQAAPGHIKKMMNQAFFERVLIHQGDPTGMEEVRRSGHVRAAENLTPVIEQVVKARVAKAANGANGTKKATNLPQAGGSNEGLRTN